MELWRWTIGGAALAVAALGGCGDDGGGGDTGGETGTATTTVGETGAGATSEATPTSAGPGSTTGAGESTASGGPGEASGTSGEGETSGTSGEGESTGETGSTGGAVGSVGCGLAPVDAADGVNVEIDAGAAGDGIRRFYLRRSPDYDPNVPHRLIFGFPGTNFVGEMIEPYFALQGPAVEPRPDEIFVYPDPLWRDFDGWGNLGGWLLGPYAAPADGEADLVFVEAVLAYMRDNYCIDEARVFATGHSWGGDMAHVVGCFLGERFAAVVPVAANVPYWFDNGGAPVDCPGDAAVWTMFGQADDHFNSQTPGFECRDFWLAERGCDGVDAATPLGLGDAADECVEFAGCSATTRFCLYGAQYGHQIPADYFAAETMAFFRSF